MKLKDKVAIVTGASSGIGRAIAFKFLEEGAKVAFVDIVEPKDDISKFKDKIIFLKCDVSNSGDVKEVVRRTIEKFNSLDIVVNNAGIRIGGSIFEVEDDTWDKTLRVNLYGPMYFTRESSKYMIEKGIKGVFINISSIYGRSVRKERVSYCSSKGGLEQLTKSSALDLSEYGIRVNAIAPGYFLTEINKGNFSDDKYRKRVEKEIPLGFLGETEYIANSAVFLSSNESKYITGEVLYVDGGWSI